MSIEKVATLAGWKGVVVGAGVLGVGLAALVAACYDAPEKNPTPGGVSQGVTACTGQPGQYPEPNCEDSDELCPTTPSTCTIAPQCGSTSTCLPLSDNTGKSTIDLRIRKLYIISPPRLAVDVIRSTVVTRNIDLNATQCAESGAGSFNWLLRVDRTNNTLITGGAPPSSDPFGVGYCFYNHKTPGGTLVTPQQVNVTFTGDTFTSEKIPKLQVPIFINGNLNNAVVLPLSDTVINKTTLANGNNCVGSFDLNALDSDCAEDPSTCTKWKTNASLGGYITLEEADTVNVADLAQSLCVTLTGSAPTPTDAGVNKCPRTADGALDLTDAQRGDYCSTSKQPGDCRDSFWLTASFAASAVKIHDGAGVTECTPE